jgi:hypothetical protein
MRNQENFYVRPRPNQMMHYANQLVMPGPDWASTIRDGRCDVRQTELAGTNSAMTIM